MKSLARLCAVSMLLARMVSAADIAGIWMGETTGRNGEKQDLAFQFQTTGGVMTGVMFGDEFDLPVQDLRIDGDRISFSVTNINYYEERRVKLVFAGTLRDRTLELTREQSSPAPTATSAKSKEQKQIITLKKLT